MDISDKFDSSNFMDDGVNMRCLMHTDEFCYNDLGLCNTSVIALYEGRTESHEQLFFLHANWEQQTKESAVVDGSSCCFILECLVTSIACIT